MWCVVRLQNLADRLASPPWAMAGRNKLRLVHCLPGLWVFIAAATITPAHADDYALDFPSKGQVLVCGDPGPVIYVDTDATGSNCGTSWEDAFTDLQDALAIASVGDQIWVAEGTYPPTPGTEWAATFHLVNGVGVYGGFDGTESHRGGRDWDVHETVPCP